jgi:hypothetical protein
MGITAQRLLLLVLITVTGWLMGAFQRSDLGKKPTCRLCRLDPQTAGNGGLDLWYSSGND